MENISISKGICAQLCAIYGRIDCLTDEIANTAGLDDQVLSDEYNHMRMQELEQAQRLTLALTELILNDTNTDGCEGSAFAKGELTGNLGGKGRKE